MQNSRYEVVDGHVRRTYLSPRRSETEQMLDIIRACFSEPTTITEIMHKANVSWKDVNDYGLKMMRRGLIVQTNIPMQNKRLFHATGEGKKAVFMWNTLRGILEI